MAGSFPRIRRPSAAALLVLLGAACSSGGAQPRFLIGDRGQQSEIRVEVVNDNFLDMAIYAVVGGANYRLGQVMGKSNRRFSLNPDRVSVSQGLRLRADPVGSRERFISDAVAVPPETMVVLNISPVLQQSYITLR